MQNPRDRNVIRAIIFSGLILIIAYGLSSTQTAFADTADISPASPRLLANGVITIIKDADPIDDTFFDFGGDLGDFLLSMQNPIDPFVIFQDVVPGDYEVFERVSVGWDLDNIVCAGGSVTVDLVNDRVIIHLSSGELITCTFSNILSIPPGSITIVKRAIPADDTLFNFTSNLGDFSLLDPTAPITTFNNLLPGVYTVTELLPAGWYLEEIDCFGGDTLVNLIDKRVVIELDPDEDIECTFLNFQLTENILYSIAVEDGWILEKNETIGTGGRINNKGKTLLIGDDGSNKQYRGFLSFNTSGIPNNAVIVFATLGVRQNGIVGNPYATLGTSWVDMRAQRFGRRVRLDLHDFQAKANLMPAFELGLVDGSGWSINSFSALAIANINVLGRTQFRLRFDIDDDNDNLNDYVRFYSGDETLISNRPYMSILYYVP